MRLSNRGKFDTDIIIAQSFSFFNKKKHGSANFVKFNKSVQFTMLLFTFKTVLLQTLVRAFQR